MQGWNDYLYRENILLKSAHYMRKVYTVSHSLKYETYVALL